MVKGIRCGLNRTHAVRLHIVPAPPLSKSRGSTAGVLALLLTAVVTAVVTAGQRRARGCGVE
jgi:hypothetical protein